MTRNHTSEPKRWIGLLLRVHPFAYDAAELIRVGGRLNVTMLSGRPTFVRIAAIIILLAVIMSTKSTPTVSTATSAPPVTVPGHASDVAANAIAVSSLPPDKVLSLTVALRPKSEVALANAAVLSRNRAPQRLTVEEIGAAIGQPSPTIDAVRSFFSEQGFVVEPVAPDRLTFKVQGTVAQIERGLSVTFSNYEDRVGHRFFSTSGDPWLPADLAPVVQAIYGLDNYPALHSLHQKVAGTAGQYTPADMRTAYDVNPLYAAGYHGEGQTIGILGCDGFLDSDIQAFQQLFGMPNAPITRVTIDDGPSGTDPEPTIDIEWSLAIAPSASIIYYGFSSGGGCSFPSMLDAMTRVVSDNQANIVSISLGACENDFATRGFLTGLENEFQAAAALNQSVFVSSGDNGAHTPCGSASGLTVSYPASSAYVTAVGGTTLHTMGSNGTYQSETVWGTHNGCTGQTGPIDCGTGGGISPNIPEPSWQSSAPILSTNGKRGLSDIAWNSDPQTGNVLYISSLCQGLCGGWGGTSIAAPQWAGLAALADQAAGRRLGQLAPLLYSSTVRDRQISTTCAAYHDVTSGNNFGYNAGPGWDFPTGWGSPNAYRLLEILVPTIPQGLTPSDAQAATSGLPSGTLAVPSSSSRVLLPWVTQNVIVC